MRLQRRFLERAGHTVTVVAPAMHGARGRAVVPDPGYLDMPSVPITVDREYSFTWPGARTDRWVDAALAGRPPVDVVHVQADFWGAYIGHRFAARHALPVVHTMHNRVDVGIAATAPLPRLVLRVLNRWERSALGDRTAGADGWAYLRRLAARSAAVTAPSAHFAHRLDAHGVVPARRAWRAGRRRLERHRRRRARCGARRRPARSRARPRALGLARAHEPREAAAALPGGARRLGRARRGRGARRRRAAARRAATGREAPAHGIRRLRRKAAVHGGAGQAAQPPMRWCRRRSASRRRG